MGFQINLDAFLTIWIGDTQHRVRVLSFICPNCGKKERLLVTDEAHHFHEGKLVVHHYEIDDTGKITITPPVDLQEVKDHKQGCHFTLNGQVLQIPHPWEKDSPNKPKLIK